MVKGAPALVCAFKCPKTEEGTFDSFFAEHEVFMKETHSLGKGAEPCLAEYYVTKGEEMGPDEKPTGSLLYILVEEYVTEAGLPAHMEAGKAKFAKFGFLMELIGKYAVTFDATAKVLTCGLDTPKPVNTTKGQVGIHFTLALDASEESNMDGLFARHEAFMRSTHACTADAGDDSKTPRYTHFSILKGKEMKDDKETGKILYSMVETYVAPEGVAGHFGQAEASWAEDLKTLKGTLSKASYVDMGATKVIASMK